MSTYRLCLLSFVLATTLALFANTAEARIGGGISAGSRGSRTFIAPPPTTVAPKGAAPIERSMAQPSTNASPKGPVGASTGGFGRLLIGGLLGAGLFGLLSGSGLFGGVTGFASLLGFLLQIALIGGGAWLLLGFFRTRTQPQVPLPGASAAGIGGGLDQMAPLSRPPRQPWRSAQPITKPSKGCLWKANLLTAGMMLRL